MLRKDEAKAYHRRNRTLRAMGFLTYGAYLASALWSRIRTRQLIEHPDCFACEGLADEVHHGCYDRATLEGTAKGKLYSVCGSCHRLAEFEPGRGKVGPVQATARLKRMRKERLAGREPGRRPQSSSRRVKEIREALSLDAAWAIRYQHLMIDE